jgi:predicted small lipoprotein YifL
MKKGIYSLLVIATLLSLSACGGISSLIGPTCNINVKADAYEPNDKPEEATPLSSAAELTGTFRELDLPDYFTTTGATGDVILLEKKFGLGEPTLRVKDADNNDLTVTPGQFQTVTLPAPGTYLIQVGLKTSGSECPDDVEYDLSITPAN